MIYLRPFLLAAAATTFFLSSCLAAFAQSTGLTTLHTFSYSASVSDGANPTAGLVQGSDGNFYGTTRYGGTSDNGTVFQVTPAGVPTILYSFNPVANGVTTGDGSLPRAGLIQGSDGNFYGTTSEGGSILGGGGGAVFQTTPTGAVTILHGFTGNDGSYPMAGLVQGGDGNFYGTTSQGGVGGGGTIFRLTPAGEFTLLYSFGSDYAGTIANGSGPVGGLVQGADGNFYGTTQLGGTYDGGTVFSITPTGTLTTLYHFGTSAADGIGPVTALIQGSNGNFYGTTSFGGIYGGNGVVFEVTPGGTLSNLYTFNGYDGSDPQGLIQSSDGNFYGTTYGGGGISNLGTIFRLSPSGTLTTLYKFADGSDGKFPAPGLVQGNDGNFYGTAELDGDNNGTGTVFQLNPAAVSAPVVTTVSLAVAGDGKAQYGVEVGKVVVRRTGDTTNALSVLYKVKGTAESGVDYKPITDYVVIPAGAIQTKIKLKPLRNPVNMGKLKAKFVLVPYYQEGYYELGNVTTAKISVVGGG